MNSSNAPANPPFANAIQRRMTSLFASICTRLVYPRRRRRLVCDVHGAPPLAIRIAAPDGIAAHVHRLDRAAWPGHADVDRAAHVRHRAVRREHGLLGDPVDLESWNL